MSVYYTGKGDDGISRVGFKKIAKTDLVMSALGDLDELNSLLGVIKNLSLRQFAECPSFVRRGNKINFPPIDKGRRGEVDSDFFQIIERIQENLFIIQAHVAKNMFEKLYKPPKFKRENIVVLEREIARLEKKLKPVRKFIIPGTNKESAWLDFARAVARRAERSVLRFSKKEKMSPDILAYLNRLSSLLFVMARVAAKKEKERSPKYN